MKGIKIGAQNGFPVKFGIVYDPSEAKSLIVKVENHQPGYKKEGDNIRHDWMDDPTHVIDLPVK